MSRMFIKSKAFCWRDWDSDEDEETSILYSEFDSDDEAASGRFWINGSESESESDGDDSDTQDGDAFVIYPGPGHQSYGHDRLRNFSQSAIEQYNRESDHRYEFVELVEASLKQLAKADFIVVTFQARKCDDDQMIITSFRAETHSTSRTLSHSSDIEVVVPLPSRSDTAPSLSEVVSL